MSTSQSEVVNHLPASKPTERDAAPADAPRQQREHFIPLRKADLALLLATRPELSPEEKNQFHEFCRLLESTFHFEFHQQIEQLKDLYAAFDPDADTRPAEEISPEERDKRSESLFNRFVFLLERSNFRPVSREELLRAMEATTQWGVNLDIDFDIFHRLELFGRGDIMGTRSFRSWRRLWMLQEVEVPLYQRLVVMFRLRPHRRLDKYVNTEHVYIKIFKNVPKNDLEMLLPGVRVKMTLLDQAKIWLPTVSGVGLSVYKILAGTVTLVIAGAKSALVFLGLIGGTVGYGMRSFFGYLSTKNQYQLNLTRSLYYQNLDNNAGVLFRLLDEAEEQECREAMLAYWLLWKKAGPEGWTERRLDDEAEALLEEATNVDVDFEVDDALEKLKRLRLVEQSPDEKLHAVPIDVALVRLDEAWDNYFTHYQG